MLQDQTDPITKGSVCGVGTFDGVHRGHQAIVDLMKRSARGSRMTGIITFNPLPSFILRKAPVYCLTSPREKEELFAALGVDFIFYFEFSEPFARLSPQDFVAATREKIGPSTVVVGENFHFGAGRHGTAQSLKEIGRGSFEVEIMSRISDEGAISSTRIRELILLGHMKQANRLLGRAYSVSGTVEKGRGRGTRIGFPTINILPRDNKLLPLDGVYRAHVSTGHAEYLGALFCQHDLIEVHIIGFSGDLYGEHVTVRFLERVRSIERFADDEALAAAIGRDIKKIVAAQERDAGHKQDQK